MREETRVLPKQLLAEIAGNGHALTPQVPAPPVAAVLRPSTWSHPPAPGEVIGDGATGARVEPVRIVSYAALAAFVQTVLARAEEIRAGALSFTLGQGGTAA